MRLVEAAQLGRMEESDLQAVAGLLEAEAVEFLRAGGSIDLAEWALLSRTERTALANAGHRLRAEMAVAIAKALDPAGAAEIASQIDPAVAEHMELRAMVERAGARVGT